MTEKNVYTALAAAQAGMGKVVKGATNPAFKSKYADLADVVAVVIPAITEHGLALFHTMTRDESGPVMRTTLAHGESNTFIHCDVPLIVDRQNMQGMKSATTYAKRIGVESVTGIAPEDDDGNAAAQAAPRQQEHRQPPRDAAPDPVQIAVESLRNAATLDALVSIWGSVRDVQKDPRVIKAKDDRKAALSNPVTDEIPY